ncbi:MAG: glycoside hydrolase family 99-like domain-containing protein [Clostridia bacterium]|nr:glycoside hydrolase family 99-like domain-containing protein [Clostridia bacterium]
MGKYDIAAYIWPAYTGDEPRTRMFWREGMGEWQSVKNSVSKYDGDTWPRKPLWGYVNEADPYIMETEINAAADHGVNVFIYDWYWFDSRPFLEQCLDNGFLKAKNNSRMRFYLMWANHDANGLWNKDISDTPAGDTVIWNGAADEKNFDTVCDRVIEKYFRLDNYYRIDGKPVFMIYDTENLIKGLGGVENTKRKLREFREKCVRAGLGGLHLQFTQWGERVLNLSGVDGSKKPDTQVLSSLGFDSMTNYQFVHFINIDRDYGEIIKDVVPYWEKWSEKYDIPYFPHVSVGWDNNPRFHNLRRGIVKNNTPDAFEKALREAKKFVDTHDLPVPLITVNSWNEWTETSYLEPDDLYGYGYLEAVKKVFGDEK